MLELPSNLLLLPRCGFTLLLFVLLLEIICIDVGGAILDEVANITTSDQMGHELLLLQLSTLSLDTLSLDLSHRVVVRLCVPSLGVLAFSIYIF